MAVVPASSPATFSVMHACLFPVPEKNTQKFPVRSLNVSFLSFRAVLSKLWYDCHRAEHHWYENPVSLSWVLRIATPVCALVHNDILT